jgi:hypothetical protein
MPNEKVPCFFTAAIKVLKELSTDSTTRFDDSRQTCPPPPHSGGSHHLAHAQKNTAPPQQKSLTFVSKQFDLISTNIRLNVR